MEVVRFLCFHERTHLLSDPWQGVPQAVLPSVTGRKWVLHGGGSIPPMNQVGVKFNQLRVCIFQCSKTKPIMMQEICENLLHTSPQLTRGQNDNRGNASLGKKTNAQV